MHIITEPGGGSALPGDPLWANVKLLVQPHAGDVGVAGLHDRGPDGRTATINTGSVAITDDSVRSPLWGAYAAPSSAEVTYSDDAGLQFGTGEYCAEIIGVPTAAGRWALNSAWGAADVAGSASHGHHFSPYLDPASSTKLYLVTGGWSPGTFTIDSGFASGGLRVAHWAFERGSDNVLRGYFNGYEFATLSSHTANYTTGWDEFTLFCSSGWGSQIFSSMKMIAFRLTHKARYGGNAFNPLWGFPEAPA